MPDFASPASMSIHEEVTRAAVTVLMPVFNNLVLFDQHKEKNTLDTIVPDLAESWTWSEDGKELTFKLRHPRPPFQSRAPSVASCLPDLPRKLP
jgi:peptide/nickel transport system substrate-binding protein